MAFKQVNAKDLKENFIKDIADEWMLVSAGSADGYNTMTASWGFVGEIWGSDCAVALVRPTRYTMKFIDENEYFTLSFYGDAKQIHKICGHLSGRDNDKAALAGLTPVFADNTVYFNQARLVLICRKQYVSALKPDCFVDKAPLEKWYNNDLHNVIIGKIEKALVQE